LGCAHNLRHFISKHQLAKTYKELSLHLVSALIRLFIRSSLVRFTHAILFHEQLVLIDVATQFLSHYLHLIIAHTREKDGLDFRESDKCLNYSVPFKYACSLPRLEGYVDILFAAMFATDRLMGVAVLHKNEFALLRVGNFVSRPFGIARAPCTPGVPCDGAQKFQRIGNKTQFETRQVFWMCDKHRIVSQTFSKHLVGWRMAKIYGHIAQWNDFLPTPPPI